MKNIVKENIDISIGVLSRTQNLITQISHLCQEIRDIKRQNKNKSISAPKDEPREEQTLLQREITMDSNQYHDHRDTNEMGAPCCTYSSSSTLSPHLQNNHDFPSRHEITHPPQSSSLPQNNQGQPAVPIPSLSSDTQLSASPSSSASYPEAPSSGFETLIGIVAGNERDQYPRNGGRLSSESDSDCESRVGMVEEGEGGRGCGGGIGLGDEH